jgi:hypothetical protein
MTTMETASRSCAAPRKLDEGFEGFGGFLSPPSEICSLQISWRCSKITLETLKTPRPPNQTGAALMPRCPNLK